MVEVDTMLYESGYIISALLVLCVIGYRFFQSKHIHSTRNVVFGILIIVGLFDIFFDFFSSICISYVDIFGNFFSSVIVHLFYLAQFLISYCMLSFVVSLTGKMKEYSLSLAFATVPLFIGLVIWFTNPFTNLLFGFESDGTFFVGELNYIVYFISAIYVLGSGVASILLTKKIGKQCRNIMIMDTVICAVLICLQSKFPRISLTGVAITLSITLMYLYLNNSDSFIDGNTNCFDRIALSQYLNGGLLPKDNLYGCIISLSGFRHINMIYGSEVGDAILSQTGEYLNGLCKKYHYSDTFRMVGDIFLILSEKENEYRAIYQQLLHSHLPYTIDDKKIDLEVKLIPIDGINAIDNKDEFIPILEFAIDKAKSIKTEEKVVVDQKLLDEYKYMQAIEKYIDTATKEKLFYMVYQPIYSINENKFTMLEALIRLKHPRYGNISPDVFIPIAEKNGMILKISDCVLDMVSDFIISTDLSALGIKSIKINLSAIDFLENNLQERIEKTLNKPNMKQGILSIEITETMATAFSKELDNMFDWFKEKDLSISMDDFGSGYANLENIMKLKFNYIKIDRSLLQSIHLSKDARNIYSGLIKVLKELEIPSIAEGVETKQDYTLLKEWNVDYIQGFYFSKPLNIDELLQFLHDYNKTG